MNKFPDHHPSNLDVLWADADVEKSRPGETQTPEPPLGHLYLCKVPIRLCLTTFREGAALFPFEDKEARCGESCLWLPVDPGRIAVLDSVSPSP